MIAQSTIGRLSGLFVVSGLVAAGLVIPAAALPPAEAVKPSSVATAEQLAAAVEDVVKGLEPTVASATSFKQGADDVEHKGYVIALIANVAAEAEGDLKWKGSALSVRDAALTLAKTKNHGEAEKAVKQIKDLMGGSAGGEAKPMPYLEVAPLKHLMKEVNDRNRPMTKNLRGAQFNRSKETIARDAHVLALLGAIARADTESAKKAKKPQGDFEKFADDMVTHAKSLAEAAGKGEQDAANTALKAVRKACSDCHQVYRPDIE